MRKYFFWLCPARINYNFHIGWVYQSVNNLANLIQLIFSLLLAKNLKCVEPPIFNVLNYAKVCIQTDQSWD